MGPKKKKVICKMYPHHISSLAENLFFKYASIVILQAKVVVYVPEVNANQLATILGIISTCSLYKFLR